MKFSIVFENSGDSIPFEVKFNEDLFTFFVDKIDLEGKNSFEVPIIGREADQKLTHLHWAISKTNEILYSLAGISFGQCVNLYEYLDQNLLNRLHADWVRSQMIDIDIDVLRFSDDRGQSELGNQLHNLYPDEIRVIKLAEAMTKLGYLYPYEEVNLAVHRLEGLFNKTNLEFLSDSKWEVFDNPYHDTMITNNDVVNFAFSYTYVGRQYYDKFRNFDVDLINDDHYNFEQLEVAFHLNLSQPETIPFSKEFIKWTESKGVRPISTQIPIANAIGLLDNLSKYREILVSNSCSKNRATIIMEK